MTKLKRHANDHAKFINLICIEQVFFTAIRITWPFSVCLCVCLCIRIYSWYVWCSRAWCSICRFDKAVHAVLQIERGRCDECRTFAPDTMSSSSVFAVNAHTQAHSSPSIEFSHHFSHMREKILQLKTSNDTNRIVDFGFLWLLFRVVLFFLHVFILACEFLSLAFDRLLYFRFRYILLCSVLFYTCIFRFVYLCVLCSTDSIYHKSVSVYKYRFRLWRSSNF